MMFFRALALLLALGSTALAQSGQIPTGTAWGNASASKAIASAVSLTSLFDRAFNANQGSILNRGASTWSSTRTPVLGLAGSVVGSIGFANATSGSMTIQPDVGALGSGIATLPAGTYALVGDTLSQGLTNKTVNKVTITPPATSATLTIPDGVTLTGPAASGTAMTLGNNETVTGVKTFGSAGAVGKLAVAGTTSGSTVVNATATASGTLTLPAATDTLVGKATTDILTNKTINSATIDSPVISGTSSGTYTFGGTPTLTTGAISSSTLSDTNTYASKDNQFTLEANGDTSKKLQFVLSGIATSTTRTQTVQNANDTFVYRATTDTLTGKTLDTAGTGNHIQISGTDITRGQILGEASTTAATAGNIGEYSESIVTSGSATSLTTATAKDITTLTLAAGDWDVTGVIYFLPAATTSVTSLVSSISSTLNTFDNTTGKFNQFQTAANVMAGGTFALPLMPWRASLSGSTTLHLVAQANFTVSTMTAYGIFRARRAR